jgi:hypothetical protein
MISIKKGCCSCALKEARVVKGSEESCMIKPKVYQQDLEKEQSRKRWSRDSSKVSVHRTQL